MNDPCNGVTNGVQNGGETLPNTTPHHTTKSTSSRNDPLAPGAGKSAATARIRSLHPVDALTAVVVSLRPDWRPEAVHATLARDRRPWAIVTRAALAAALDPDVRHPAAIENHGPTVGETPRTPTPPSLRYLETVQRCPHGAESGLCALCRNGQDAA